MLAVIPLSAGMSKLPLRPTAIEKDCNRNPGMGRSFLRRQGAPQPMEQFHVNGAAQQREELLCCHRASARTSPPSSRAAARIRARRRAARRDASSRKRAAEACTCTPSAIIAWETPSMAGKSGTSVILSPKLLNRPSIRVPSSVDASMAAAASSLPLIYRWAGLSVHFLKPGEGIRSKYCIPCRSDDPARCPSFG